jgi:D-alanine-D-alanine ligase
MAEEGPLALVAIAVLAGGRSSERDVSLTSGKAVLDALRSRVAADDRRGPMRVDWIEIQPDGLWRGEDFELRPELALARLAEVGLFFIALHGGEGEGGTVQGFLRACGRRFTGSDVTASALCLDKAFARALAADAGLRVPRARLFRRAPASGVEENAAFDSRMVEALLRAGGEGCFVKPRRGGSSVGVAFAHDPAEIAAAVREVHLAGDDALVEARVLGVEVTGPVLGNRRGSLEALVPVEIQPKEGRFFDYEEKYSPSGAREIVPPESLSAGEVSRVKEAALAAHRAFGCDGYSRTDFIVPRGRGEGEPFFLETNTLPGMTPRSLFPKAAAHQGLDFRGLCLRIAELGLAAEGDSR